VLDDLSHDPRPDYCRGADAHVGAAADQQDLAEVKLGADVCVEQVNLDKLIGLNAVLLAACADDCVNGWASWGKSEGPAFTGPIVDSTLYGRIVSS
jgi:hypothetical protein